MRGNATARRWANGEEENLIQADRLKGGRFRPGDGTKSGTPRFNRRTRGGIPLPVSDAQSLLSLLFHTRQAQHVDALAALKPLQQDFLTVGETHGVAIGV